MGKSRKTGRGWQQIALSFPALYALAALPAAAQDDGYKLGTIVIFGGKTERSFTDTAASVSVMGSEDIEAQGMTDLRETFSKMGNVIYTEGGSGNAGFTIRGLSAEGTTESFNTAPATGMIIDGTAQTVETMRRGARGLWDVDQVEVYRGPQSTLQGRGAMSGAVIVETKDPTFHFEADTRAIIGSQSRQELAFALSGPIIPDILAFRLSGETRERDRGIDYKFPGFDVIDQDKFRNLRGKLLFLPPGVPGLSFDLTLSDTYDRPGLSEATRPFFDRVFAPGADGNIEVREGENFNASLEVKYDFGNDLVLTSVTSWLDASALIYAPPGQKYFRDADWTDKNFSQDLRLNFGNEDSELSGVFGLYFGHFTQSRWDNMTYAHSPYYTETVQNFTRDTKNTHLSAYGDVYWKFVPGWTLNLGGRLLYEEVTGQMFGSGTLIGPNVAVDAKTDDLVFLPKLGLTYHLNDYQSLSATASQGYRSGYIAITTVTNDSWLVKPEYLDSYELAYRAEDPDGAWRLGANLFYSIYNDQQIQLPPDLTTVPITPARTASAGKSKMYGLELEGEYLFDNGLTIFGSIGLLRTKFIRFSEEANGNEFPMSPRKTASLGVLYDHHSGYFGSISATYSDSYYSTQSVGNAPHLKVPAYTRVDAQAGYRINDKVDLIAYVDNLLDKDYITSLSGGPPAIQADVSEPRTFGIELRARF